MMGTSEWIAFGSLLFTIAMGGGGVIAVLFNSKAAILERLQKDKTELADELNALRLAAYEEYRTLRKEIQEVKDTARKEFGETIAAIKEKIIQVEFWTRDQLQETRHTIYGRIDMMRMEAAEKLDDLENRTRQLELFTAREMGRKEFRDIGGKTRGDV